MQTSRESTRWFTCGMPHNCQLDHVGMNTSITKQALHVEAIKLKNLQQQNKTRVKRLIQVASKL